ncbi:Glycoside hydrolase, 38 vacuolar alpha mannosidase [Lithohypha guttulata]|uniref:Glycoside hydrolase, 38 vacuolar alpha mannosidase n=1 Tax=Lithohypha guttulata TaxID=1690604 RepID=UPI002DDE99DC|nr:Glycoside hydrolase, 38 vacuolar alpha mannosidase [Lithohypha guttulata]KAK5099717.1 Glycoside hydrolase, 38 vacuolar alpha mannosidase [Lithohypha guttulata]
MGGRSTPLSSSYPKLVERPVGKQIESIYTGRLRQFTDRGQYYHQGLLAKLYHNQTNDSKYIKLSVYSPPDLTRPTFKEATSQKFKPARLGDTFGPSWSTHWFKVQLTVPKNMLNAEHLEFHWDAGNEGLVWSEDGKPLQGLTGGGERVEWILPQDWQNGKEHTFYVEMACNKMFGNAPGGDTIQPPDPNTYYTLSQADIMDVNLAVRGLYVDFWEIGDAAREFPEDGWQRHKALQVCNAIMDAFIAGDGSQESILKGRKIAQEYIGKHVSSPTVYDSKEESIVYAIGHCHIDTCWLWPWAETKRKVVRSWSSQCDLMDRYPEHRFACSQAQQYKWLKEYYPFAFDRVKEKVKRGQFQPIGGSWVEHDTNMPSGESLVRQFLYGQRFFESHFGERCQTFWLPDTFGYSSQLPQICRLAGMSRFFTQKLSWNNINNFPHTTFNWVALDGSQVICHMAPSETYTADADFGDVVRSVSQHKSLDQDNTSLLVFGKGDGGGGPTRDMLEKLRRLRGMADTTAGGVLPRVHMGNTVDDFFKRLEDKVASGTDLVTWYGELYFELHRGTYTTQANNKRNNRKQEIMMHDIEYLATLASLSSKKYQYPKKEIDELWENILLCQFHDCLPGSSIEMCYDDSDELYAHNDVVGTKLKDNALAALGMSKSRTASRDCETVAINTLPWDRTEIVKTPGDGYTVVHAETGINSTDKIELLASEKATVTEKKDGVFILANSRFAVEVENGVITSLFDKKVKREVIAHGGKGNQLVLFDDKPLYWQAWDVEVFHLNSRKELPSGRTEIVDTGPYRVSVATKTKISDQSWVKTTISLDAATGETDSPSYVSVEADVEWHETMKFLKVEFPVDVFNTEATYETQYGLVRRPTHYNTSWDMAKFEVCCHKFADLSEANYGVSVLNDSKYGFATCGNLMRLSLLRAPKAPDAHADMGHHTIKWAIMPHAGALSAETVHAAHNFNNPLSLVTINNEQEPDEDIFTSIVVTGSSSLVLDCVKRGEDDEDVSRGEFDKRKGRSVILRIYESMGGKSRGTIRTTLSVDKVFKTNVLEDDLQELKLASGEVEIELRPFEVVTYRLQLSS